MKWQPIETAPMDGTRVLLYRDGWQEDRACCWYDGVRDEWVTVGGGVFADPIVWMPLPEPPDA